MGRAQDGHADPKLSPKVPPSDSAWRFATPFTNPAAATGDQEMCADSLNIGDYGSHAAKFALKRPAVAHFGIAMGGIALGALAAGLLVAASPACAKSSTHGAKPASSAVTPVPAADDDSKVARALAQGDFETAVALGEAAVAKNPRAPGVRVVLGRVYLRMGRFESAAAMLGDARALGDSSGRTALGLALAQIACGRSGQAVAVLDAAQKDIPVSDYGLALAMASESARGVAVLGDALRAGDKSPKLRQNLAYAYALDGRWGEARLMAAFDLAPDQLDARLAQWAETARPDAPRKRVAALIGVPLRDDSGAPMSLLLGAAPAGPAPVLDAARNAVQAAPKSIAPETAAAAPAVPQSAPIQPAVVQQAAFSPTAAPSADQTAPSPLAPTSLAQAPLAPVAPSSAPAAPAAAASTLASADPAPAAAASETAAAAAASAPVVAEAAPKTDANGELPPIDHAQSAQVLARAEAPAAPAAPPSAAMLTLHRADTTHLVGVALAHSDLAAARHARHHRADHAPADHAPANQGADHLAMNAPSEAAPVATSASADPVPATPPVEAHPIKASRLAAHQSEAKPHTAKHHHDGANLAQAAAPSEAAPHEANGASTHLVQLGAFSSQQNADHARQTFLARDPSLSHHQFVITQALVNGRNFWRVAVMGFDAGSASHMCGSIKHHGGACFAYAAGRLPGGQVLALATPHQDQARR